MALTLPVSHGGPGEVLATSFMGSVGLVEVSLVSPQPPAVLPLLVAANFVFSSWRPEVSGADKSLKGKSPTSSDEFVHSSCCCPSHSAFSICGCGLASPLPVGLNPGNAAILQMKKLRLGGLDALSKGM